MLHGDGCSIVALLCELLVTLLLIPVCSVLQVAGFRDGISCCIRTPAELPELLLQLCTCCPL